MALGVYLTETTHNAVWLGLLTVAAWMPAIIGSPLGGVIADRVDRQRWIQCNNLVMALDRERAGDGRTDPSPLSPQLACYLAIVEGLCSSASWAAWQSLLPDLVERDEVLAAVSLSSAQFNLGRIIGPVLAGVTLAFGSRAWCFALNAVSFIFVVVVFSFVRSAARAQADDVDSRLGRDHGRGAQRAWSVRGCRNPIIGVGTVALIVSPFITLVPAMAIQTLHAGKVGTVVAGHGPGRRRGDRRADAARPGATHLAPGGAARFARDGRAGARALRVRAHVWRSRSLALVVLGGAYVGTLTGLNTVGAVARAREERSRILSLYTLVALDLLSPRRPRPGRVRQGRGACDR